MSDQVGSLNREPVRFQIGEPGAPCDGHSTCTDTVVGMIVRHETGAMVSARQVRAVAAPGKDPCRGLNPTEALRGIYAFGIHGYGIHVNPTASDVIRATDRGIVLVAVGYDGFPAVDEAEVGGRTDLGFNGPHATSLWGRRYWSKPPRGWPKGRPFKPGWRVWMRDPDHHFGAPKPPYDRFESGYLVRAMDALVGNEGWQVRLAIYRSAVRPTFKALEAIEPHAVEPILKVVDDYASLPDFGSGQRGDVP